MSIDGEAPRDQIVSGFTRILRDVLHSAEGVLAAAFVDSEGESVDYCSRLDPFEAKIAGAQLLPVFFRLKDGALGGLGARPRILHIRASKREFWIRSIGADYVLVLIARAGGITHAVRVATESAISRIKNEGRLNVELEDTKQDLRVVFRGVLGFGHAPTEYSVNGITRRVRRVQNRWYEKRAKGQLFIVFDVETEDGRVVTLRHDTHRDHWSITKDVRK